MEARRRRASICPVCYALVPVQEAALRPLNVSRGRLSGRGYRVEVSENRLLSRLEIFAE